MRIEKLTRKGRDFAVLPFDILQKLLDDSEMLSDVKAYDAAKQRLENGEDELIPFEMVERRTAGESPLKIWREYRGFTQEQLAAGSSVSRAMVAAIESGRRQGGITTLKKLASTLDVDLENLT